MALMSSGELSFLKIFQGLEQLRVIPSKVMFLKIEQLPIPDLFKVQIVPCPNSGN